jgi:hypothetical protein
VGGHPPGRYGHIAGHSIALPCRGSVYLFCILCALWEHWPSDDVLETLLGVHLLLPAEVLDGEQFGLGGTSTESLMPMSTHVCHMDAEKAGGGGGVGCPPPPTPCLAPYGCARVPCGSVE